MARQRMVKPEFFDSESLGACSITARLAFIGLWVTGDDYGNQKAQASRLKLKIFPYDNMTEGEFIDLLCELEQAGCVKGYVVDDERYINIPNFSTYQTVRKPSKSSIPEPPKSTVKAKRTKVLQEWRNGESPVTKHDGSTTQVQHQYDTSNPNERKNEGREGVLTNSFSNEIGASDGAAVAEATPPSAFQCPTCGMEMERTNSHRGDKVLHRCKLCAEEVWA